MNESFEDFAQRLYKEAIDKEERDKNTEEILKACRTFRVKKVAIRTQHPDLESYSESFISVSLFIKGRYKDWPTAWAVAKLLDWRCCGNSNQYQIPHNIKTHKGLYEYINRKWVRVDD